MRYPVLVQRRPDGSYQALVPMIPDMTRIAATRDEAIASIRSAIADAMQTTEVVYLDVPGFGAVPNNPWLETAGIFADDPDLDPMLHAIYTARENE
ncbi:MAG: type II toxin-antitoxin system HicB family antitoxin [Oscillochloridaceae bacterium umkhey_bin13]